MLKMVVFLPKRFSQVAAENARSGLTLPGRKIRLSPCFLHSPDMGVSSRAAVKLRTALLSAISCHFRHLYDPPPPRPPPALHPVAGFYSPGSTPPIVRSPGSFFLHHHHQCLGSYSMHSFITSPNISSS